jgi:SAM-dependent methyltransferase
MTAPAYALGHADAELERLQLQADIISPVTRRLIRDCGIAPGMRVLDIGCGAGDVAMLLAEAVGPSGAVVAIDREQRAIEVARARAEKAGYRQIGFLVSPLEMLPQDGSFDAAVGRYVLVHQSDPTAMVRHAGAAVRQGGVVAFHEPALHLLSETFPPIDLFVRVAECLRTAVRLALPNYDVAGRLIACFEDAALPGPRIIWESLVDGPPSSPIMRWAAKTYQVLYPQLAAAGVASPELGDPETLADRLAAEMVAVRAQVVTTPQVCAWARRP